MKTFKYLILGTLALSGISIFLMLNVSNPKIAAFGGESAIFFIVIFTILLFLRLGFAKTLINKESEKVFDNFLRDTPPVGYNKNYITCCSRCHIFQNENDILIVRTGVGLLKKYKIKDFRITNSIYGESAIFIIDDNRKKIVLLGLTDVNSICKEANYEDLLSVSLKTDGKTISEKSTMRTVAGAAVGGVLLGGAGAIVGGLSGDTTSTQAVSKVILKFTFRDIGNPNFELVLLNMYPPIKPNDIGYSEVEKALSLGNKIKDVCAVIIDKVDSTQKEQSPISNLSVAEELKKFADLVKEGIISQKDFEEQKKKLLKL